MAVAAKRDAEEDAMGGRRCIVTGMLCPAAGLIRFVAGPDGEIVPDIEGKLPGRGLWVTAQRAVLDRATSALFSKAAKAPRRAPAGLAALTEKRLAARMCDDLGLARRAGLLVFGFDNVLRALDDKVPPRLLVEAADGAPDGRRKLENAALARQLTLGRSECLTKDEISLALGRENVIHAAVKPGALAERLLLDSARLAGLRASPALAPKTAETAGPNPARNERDL
jgi:uncharacterized protein